MAATLNPFDLLQDADADDPAVLLAAVKKPVVSPAAPAPAPAKLPTKPAPPQQAVRDSRNQDAPRRGGGFGRGGGGRTGRGGQNGPNRDYANGESNGFRGGRSGRGGPNANREYTNGDANGFTQKYGEGGAGGEFDARKQSEEPGKRGFKNQQNSYHSRQADYSNGVDGDEERRPPRRTYERRSGTGQGNEVKRYGAGRGNWGTITDDVIGQESNENGNADEKVATTETEVNLEKENGLTADAEKDKESPTNEQEEKEAEDKEMTLEEYEKIREEKRKALLALKAEERKVEADKEFDSMKQLSIKKENDEVFIKLGSDKDSAKKREHDREERAKKSLSINEFLKPADGGEQYYGRGGRGRGRGRGGGYAGGRGGGNNYRAPAIQDPEQFPTLGGK